MRLNILSLTCLLLAFLLAVGIALDFIPYGILRYLFIILLALALLFRFLPKKKKRKKNNQPFYKEVNIIFYVGPILFLVGIAFKLLNLPYTRYILILALFTTGMSFFAEPKKKNKGEGDSHLDN